MVMWRGRTCIIFGSTRGDEVEVGGFLVFFCGGGWTWRIVWQ